MAVEGSKMCFVSAFMFVATAATLLTPDKGFEVTMGTGAYRWQRSQNIKREFWGW